MKKRIFIAFSVLFLTACSTSKQAVEDPFYRYITIDGPFDILVFDSYAGNSDCAKGKELEYGVIIGNAVVGERLEPITVLVSCLPTAVEKGEVVSIKPVKPPKKELVYKTMSINNDPTTNAVIGSGFSTVWGEVIP